MLGVADGCLPLSVIRVIFILFLNRKTYLLYKHICIDYRLDSSHFTISIWFC